MKDVCLPARVWSDSVKARRHRTPQMVRWGWGRRKYRDGPPVTEAQSRMGKEYEKKNSLTAY